MFFICGRWILPFRLVSCFPGLFGNQGTVPSLLGAIHGDIRLLHQAVEGLSITRVNGNANADGHVYMAPSDNIRLAQPPADFRGERRGNRWTINDRQYDKEPVSAKTTSPGGP